jgi:hypothetical protein
MKGRNQEMTQGKRKTLTLLLTLALLLALAPASSLPARADGVKDVGTWVALKEAMNASGSYRLTADIVWPQDGQLSVVQSGNAVTLDLNGHTLTNRSGGSFEVAGSLTLKDGKGGGAYRYDNANGSCWGVDVYAGGSFTLSGGTISGFNNDCVYLHGRENESDTPAVFTMNGGAISGNNGTGVNVTGVNVGSGVTFTMNGGTISSCGTYGVFVNGGSFILNNGTVSQSAEHNVYVLEGGVTMKGGSITKAAHAAVVVMDGEFSMSGGKISNSKMVAICVYKGTLTVSGSAEISDNEGNGVIIGDQSMTARFTMSGGKISGNGENGVSVGENATFEMTGGTIGKSKYNGVSLSGSFALKGGAIAENDAEGVQLYENAVFAMSGGTISGSRQTGVYVSRDAESFTMTGGAITENESGVYVENEALFRVSGSPRVFGNRNGNGYLNDVYLSDSYQMRENDNDPWTDVPAAFITVTGALGETARIGVRANSGMTIARAAAGYTLTASDAAKLVSDEYTCEVTLAKDGTAVLTEANAYVYCVETGDGYVDYCAAFPWDKEALLIVSVYDADGRLSGLYTASDLRNGEEVVLSLDGFKLNGRRLKLMLLDRSTFAPLCKAWEN